MSVLEVRNLHATVEGKEILKGVNLKIATGEVHAIMGPNGSGKSTLSLAIMGHPKYLVTKGEVLLDGENVLEMTPDERARKGLFLAFQQPVEIAGVSISKFLFNAYAALHHEQQSVAREFPALLKKNLGEVGLDEDFSKRQLNHGFSGGEKKRNEILQLSVLRPKIAVLDEIDSGLDIDALKTVSRVIRNASKDTGMLVITHYQRILHHLKPDFVHIMVDGKIVKSGSGDLAGKLEEKGYAGLLKDLGIEYKESVVS